MLQRFSGPSHYKYVLLLLLLLLQTQGNINLESPKSYIDYQYNMLKYAETPNALAKSPEIRSVLNELKEEIMI